MVEVEGHWLPPEHSTVYHGQTRGPDGTVWVYRRLHTGAGLHVEVHLDNPDGVVIQRSVVAHLAEAASVVHELRDLVSRRGIGAISGEIAPLAARGSVVVHASGWQRYQTGYGRLDEGAQTRLCSRIWALPGRHRVVASFVPDRADCPSVPSSADGVDIVIEPYSTIDVRLRMWPGNDPVRGRRWVHQCRVAGVPFLRSKSRKAPVLGAST